MAKKLLVRTLMESQHVTVSETLLNPLRQKFCHIFFIKLKEFQFEKFLVSSIWKIETIYSRIDSQWQVFSLCKSEYLIKSIRMQFSPKPNMFWQIFSAFLTLHQILNILKKEMSVIAHLLPKLSTEKSVVS